MATQGKITVGSIASLGLLLVFLYGSSVQCQTATAFTPSDEFSIPNSHSLIRFGFNGTYTSASLSGATWHFKDLASNNSQRTGNLKLSAENSNVTILAYRTGNQLIQSARLTYSVEGNGTQTINFCLNNTQPTHFSEWSVILPGSIFLAPGDVWRLLPDDSIVVSGIVGNVTVVHYDFQAANNADQPFYIQHSVALASVGVLAATVVAAVTVRYRGRR